MKRIGVKLWSVMMLLIAVVLILLWLFQIVFLDQFYQNIKITSLTRQGAAISTSVEVADGLEAEISQTGLLDRIDRFAYSNQLSVQIIDRGGNTLYEADYSNSMMGRGMMMNSGNDVYDRALSGEAVTVKKTHPRFGTDYLLIGIPIVKEASTEGAMIINVPLAPVEDTVDILKQQLLWITLILIGVTVVISYWLSGAFTKPILKLHELAESYSEGSFDRRIKVDRADELGILADRMNKMGERLAQNEQLRKDLIANVSHELRTPLSLIRGYAETLRDVTGDNPMKREKQLGIIIDETERLSRIVEDILSLSQFQAGAVVLNQKPYSLNSMLSDILKRYETAGIAREITLDIIPDGEITVVADRSKIEQVLYNLINNAVQHTNENGTIAVTLKNSQSIVRIEVTDNGDGIAEEELPNVFDRYYQGKKQESSLNSGTGLGLAIVKNILQTHQVAYGVQSRIGQGTTFWFELNKNSSHTSF